ncbi:hypothetical protein ACMD2_26509 [Ananas comosus]|uniref:Transmembrane protein n=1 Tax=Ananas comosus TaxID=4615 RepID=A0A199VTP9_ANACO|nr:hypothetical protein ACMD2_26509 [Ananas comosus]
MGKAMKIIRRSIHVFFKNYHPAASAAAILALPYSLAALLSHSSAISPSSAAVSRRLHAVFEASGFPASSRFFSLLNLRLSQAVLAFASTLPFSLTFLLLAKAHAIQAVSNNPLYRRRPPLSPLSLYSSLLSTYVFAAFVTLAANAAIFSLLFLAFSTVEILTLSPANFTLAFSILGIILYSVLLTNTIIACNMAIVIACMEERCSGCVAFLRALVLIKGRAATAIAVALPATLGRVAIEALFRLRVARSGFGASTLCEGLLIGYMYSTLIVVDTVITCMLYRSCVRSQSQYEGLEAEEKGALHA